MSSDAVSTSPAPAVVPQTSGHAPSGSAPASGARPSVQLKRAVQGRSLAEQIQMLAPRDAGGGEGDVHAAAAHGLTGGGGGALPFVQRIQQSFGGHDVSGVQSHVGGRAAEASAAMGAEAYASGESVAFAEAPSLHTAAHEAAHVVQQRAGVQLSGGVGAAGDSYEQNADAVADRVVKGESATDLLPSLGGGGGAAVQRRAVQRFAGNVDNATVHGGGQGSVRDQVTENHGDGPAGARDSNFNPALKAEFETLLGRALIHGQAFYRPVVENVSFGIYRYLQAKAEALQKSEEEVMQQAFNSMTFMFGDGAPDVFYGRIVDRLNGNQDTQYFGKMMALVSTGAGTVQNHMLAHQCFLDKILDGGEGDVKSGAADQYFARMREKAATSQDPRDQQLANGQDPDLKHLREDSQNDVFGEANKGVNDMHARGRLDARKGGVEGFNQAPKKGAPGLDQNSQNLPPGVRYDARISDRNLRSEGSTGITAAENQGALPALTDADREQGLGQKHSRGLEQYTLDESQKFIQEARVKYNMPMAAGISGTTTDLHEVAKMMGVAGPQSEFRYQLACLAHLQTAGAHSFHEIMGAAALNTAVQYEPGNYRSILRYGVEQIPEVAALFADPKYAQVPGIGDPAALGGRTSEAPAGGAPAGSAAPASTA